MDKRIFALIALICIGALAYSIFTPKEGKIFIFPVASAKSKEEVKGIKEEKLSSAYKYTRILSFPWDQSFSFTNPQNYLDLSKELPYVRAKNAISVNLNKNTILFSREEHRPVPIASVTKIMTATIALEHKKLTDKIKVSKKAATVGENAMGISEGETYTLEDLLYGLILHSGNDAAVAIAEGVAGTEENFVFYMNSKAKELGLNETKYADSNGLNDGNVSSAYDQAKLTKYALQNPDFKKVVATLEHTVNSTEEHKYLQLSNQTNLLRTYPGVMGVKTGYTEAANLCLVTYAVNEGQEIIGVVLNSDARKTDMIQLLDYSFEKLGIKISHPLLNF